MTDQNRSHITLVVDRTGSMAPIREDAEGAVNAFLEDQKKAPNPCTFLGIEFDAPGSERYNTGTAGSTYIPWFHVWHDGDLKTVPTYRLTPRGNTALWDAIGQGITRTGEVLAALHEDERPGKVFFVVQTDGQENSSRDWMITALKDLIRQQEDVYQWTFIFLGTGLEAQRAAQAFAGTGMHANTVKASDSGASYMATYEYTSSNISSARVGSSNPAEIKWGAEVDEKGQVEPDDVA